MEYLKKIKELIATIDIFREKNGLTLNEFNEIWDSRKDSQTSDMNRKTFARHIDAIFDMFGIQIVCGKGYKYKISNPDIFDGNSTGIWLYRSFSDISKTPQRDPLCVQIDLSLQRNQST